MNCFLPGHSSDKESHCEESQQRVAPEMLLSRRTTFDDTCNYHDNLIHHHHENHENHDDHDHDDQIQICVTIILIIS